MAKKKAAAGESAAAKTDGKTAAKPKAKRGRPRTKTTKVKRRRGRYDYETLRAKVDESQIVDYDIDKDYTETEAINHKQFGIGVILKILDQNKIEVVFEENEKKVLAQNWHASS